MSKDAEVRFVHRLIGPAANLKNGDMLRITMGGTQEEDGAVRLDSIKSVEVIPPKRCPVPHCILDAGHAICDWTPPLRYHLIPPEGATGDASDAAKTWLVAREDGNLVGRVVFDDFPDAFRSEAVFRELLDLCDKDDARTDWLTSDRVRRIIKGLPPE
jgi:hypothetical protein